MNRLCTGWCSINSHISGHTAYRTMLNTNNERKRITLRQRKTVEISVNPENWYGSWWMRIPTIPVPMVVRNHLPCQRGL